MWFAAGYFSNHSCQIKSLFFFKLENFAVQMRKRVLSSEADEVARNGAYPRITSARGSLGRPLHFRVNRSPNRIAGNGAKRGRACPHNLNKLLMPAEMLCVASLGSTLVKQLGNHAHRLSTA